MFGLEVLLSGTAVAIVSQKSLRAQTFKAQLGRIPLATVHTVQYNGSAWGKTRSADVKLFRS